jgi:hypothetical protein
MNNRCAWGSVCSLLYEYWAAAASALLNFIDVFYSFVLMCMPLTSALQEGHA